MPSAQESPRPDAGGKPFYLFVGNRVAIAALLPMVVAGFLLSYLFIDRKQHEASADLQRYVDGVARELGDYFESSLSAAQTMADTAVRLGPPTAETHSDLAELFRAHRPLALRAVLANAAGEAISASPPAAEVPPAVPSADGAAPQLSGLQTAEDGRPVFSVSIPMHAEDGAPLGVFYARFALPERRRPPFEDGHETLALEDAQGHRWPLTAPSSGMAGDLIQASQTVGYGFVVHGARAVGGVFALNEFGEYAIVGTMLLLASLVSWLVAQGVAHYVTRPLNRLAQDLATFNFEEKEHDLEVPGEAPREIRALLGEFNALLQRLRSSYAELRASLEESQLLRQRMERLIEERDETIRSRTADLQSRTVQLERANAVLERVASEDGLTGVSNRRAFDEFLALVWRLSMREKAPVSLILLDVDRFKLFNDRYGHPAGDECLRQVASVTKSFTKRPLDLVARYGGEEFAIVLGRTGLVDAVEVAETLRRAVQALQIEHKASGIEEVVTCSFGVATMMADLEAQPEDLIARADEYLYAAKKNGRNRVEYEFASQSLASD